VTPGNVAGLRDLLRWTQDLGGSDLHLSAGSPPQVRVDGRLRALDRPVLAPAVITSLCYGVLTDVQQQRFEAACDLDVAIDIDGVGRVRGNLYRQKGALGAAFRLIPGTVRSIEELGLPTTLSDLADRPRGLVLVTGSTGSGKSTTLAAMIDRINRLEPVHILTIEDPIEHLHEHKAALVNQREVHADTPSFSAALRAALREDPDVVLVGEMRDLETMDAALMLAETGHLTMATLHTNSAAQTISRIIDAFPAGRQAQIRTQLSLVIEGIVCQTLVPRADGGGRVAALEVLVATPAIRSLIREDKIHQIYGTMQAGQEKHGMQTLNQALARLVERRAIARDAAFRASPNRDELTGLLDRRVSLHRPTGAIRPSLDVVP
jgi:twitching motility protein PilT